VAAAAEDQKAVVAVNQNKKRRKDGKGKTRSIGTSIGANYY